MTRRWFLKGLVASVLSGLFVSLYAFLIEPSLRLRVRNWRVRRADWPKDRPLKIAVLSDLHVCEPFLPLRRLRRIVTRINALGADLIVMLGDLTASHSFVQEQVPLEDICAELGKLDAPLGVYGVLGNHDWWDDAAAQARRGGPVAAETALARNGLLMMDNRATELSGGIWIAGLGDQLALKRPEGGFEGVDDLPATLAQIPLDAPTILLAHEPDIFPQIPKRIALTLSGHTHGGQIRLFGYSPKVPSRYGNRFAYGLVEEGGRALVVSGGIGCSILPIRLGVVPEITVVELSA